MYFILKIETYQKSPRNYPISAEMKKEIDKLEKYNLQVRFLTENKIDSLEELDVFHEMNKELLNDISYTRKRTYEQKSKSNDSIIKEECNLKVEFYNEIISDLQAKVKTCKIIINNYDKIDIELNKSIINKLEQVR